MKGPSKGYVNPFGYRRIPIPGTGKFRMEHVLVWEAANGPVPAGKEIHHLNGDKLDNRLENLKALTRLEHKRIHSDCYRCGDQWFKRCRRCRWYRSVDEEFYVYPGRSGVMGVCKRCAIDLACHYKKQRQLRRRQQAEGQQAERTADTPAAAGVQEGGEG